MTNIVFYYRVIHPEIFDVLDAMRKVTGVRTSAAKPNRNACTCPNCAMKQSSRN